MPSIDLDGWRRFKHPLLEPHLGKPVIIALDRNTYHSGRLIHVTSTTARVFNANVDTIIPLDGGRYFVPIEDEIPEPEFGVADPKLPIE